MPFFVRADLPASRLQIRGLDVMPEYDLRERQEAQDKVDKPPTVTEDEPKEAAAVEADVEPKETQ